MPWKVFVRDGRYCVYKVKGNGKRTGAALGCHDRLSEAQAQMKALYATENKSSLPVVPGAEPLVMNMRSASFSVKSTENGYMWVGVSSNNAKDRDDEVVSEKALVEDCNRRQEADKSVLLWSHIKNIRLGGAPFYKAVVNGMLVEAGYFDDSPLAKIVAKFLMANPDAFDGKGWGISIGFKGLVDNNGVYHAVDIVERSVLPLSRAANPYTTFSMEGMMDKQKKAALDELVKALTGDDESLQVLKGILGAAETSKSLDEQGVMRKAAAEPTEKVAEVAVEKAKPSKPPKKQDMMEDDEEDDEEEMPKKKPGKKSTDDEPISDDLLKGIAEFVSFSVKEAQNQQAAEINEALTALVDNLKALVERVDAIESGEAKIAAIAEAPRGVFERLKSFSVTQGSGAEIDEDDEDDAELVKAANSNQPSDPILASFFGVSK